MPYTTNGHFALGAVSSGTLRSQDLLRAFADAYEAVLPFNGRRMAEEAREIAATLDKVECDPIEVPAYELASEMIEDLMTEINYVLSQNNMNVYFGAHDGDGACFGFWEYSEE